MKITEVRIRKIKKSSLLAFANVTFDDTLVVTGIKVVDGSKGIFVAFPSLQGSDGDYHDIVYPITAKAREAITNAVIKAYEDAVDNTRAEEKPKRRASKSKNVDDLEDEEF